MEVKFTSKTPNKGRINKEMLKIPESIYFVPSPFFVVKLCL